MVVAIDAGDRQYELVEGWGDLPSGWKWGQVGDVAVDSRDRVHVFTRTDHPYMIFDRSGHLEWSWGTEIFMDAHGICIAPDDSVFLVDRNPQLVFKFTADGRHLLTLGKRDKPSDTGYTRENPTVRYPGPPFHHPTNVGLSPNGEFYVSDGYRNCRVHKYSPEGELLFSWGEPGEGPGQLQLVHGVREHKGRVYVCDRQNNRIQIFTPQGEYVDVWPGFSQPCKIYVDKDDVMYIAELGARVSIVDLQGNVLGRWGSERTHEPGLFWGPHGIATDSEGSIYVSEVLEGARLQKFARKR
jgi:DNA-binding beta-propeller fold protein YncE